MNHDTQTSAIKSFKTDSIPKIVIKNSIPALIASIFRQGIIFIPALFIMKEIIGVDGLLWAQPVADVLSLAVVIIMLCRKIKKTDFAGPEVSVANE